GRHGTVVQRLVRLECQGERRAPRSADGRCHLEAPALQLAKPPGDGQAETPLALWLTLPRGRGQVGARTLQEAVEDVRQQCRRDARAVIAEAKLPRVALDRQRRRRRVLDGIADKIATDG